MRRRISLPGCQIGERGMQKVSRPAVRYAEENAATSDRWQAVDAPNGGELGRNHSDGIRPGNEICDSDLHWLPTP